MVPIPPAHARHPPKKGAGNKGTSRGQPPKKGPPHERSGVQAAGREQLWQQHEDWSALDAAMMPKGQLPPRHQPQQPRQPQQPQQASEAPSPPGDTLALVMQRAKAHHAASAHAVPPAEISAVAKRVAWRATQRGVGARCRFGTLR